MSSGIHYDRKPFILVVDDVPKNLQVIGETLMAEGYDISMAGNGLDALEIIKNEKPDLILLDVMMPELDGFETCKRIKANADTADIPVIFLTAKNETKDIVKGFELGGVDYVTKPFTGREVTARIKTHLDLKFSKEKLIEVNQTINDGLRMAAGYVESLLPDKMTDGPIKTDWRFEPCEHLGGDSFGYHWIDDYCFAFYLLDVCGHGVGPALHSVTALNSLRFQLLPSADFKSPLSVVSKLNQAYQMLEYNDMYFTLFYGVYNTSSSLLKYVAAGHPPAISIDDAGEVKFLGMKNFVLGGMPDFKFKCDEIEIEKPTDLYIYSDGAIEIKLKDGGFWCEKEMAKFLKDKRGQDVSELDLVYQKAIDLQESDSLSDDFSIIKITIIP